MQTRVIPLSGGTPGTQRTLTVLQFGKRGARPKCHVQTGLHADEIPGLLVVHHLRARLHELEAAGRITGEIVVVPAANPIGLAQHVSGSHVGRFCLADGGNFNRGYPALFDKASRAVEGRLGADAGRNERIVREALQGALRAMPVVTEHQALRHALMSEAVDADVVLDLHCDTEAVLHLYTGTALVEDGKRLAQLLGARALLVAEISGDDPFDEACSRPWWELARHFPAHPLPQGCFSATVELRGATDVSHQTADGDARALIDFMILRGAITGDVRTLPALLCEPTPLKGSEPIVASRSGVVVFRRGPGDFVDEGDAIADLVDPVDGAVVTLTTPTSGLLYARAATRWAHAGMRLAKVAGPHATRDGRLLSP